MCNVEILLIFCLVFLSVKIVDCTHSMCWYGQCVFLIVVFFSNYSSKLLLIILVGLMIQDSWSMSCLSSSNNVQQLVVQVKWLSRTLGLSERVLTKLEPDSTQTRHGRAGHVKNLCQSLQNIIIHLLSGILIINTRHTKTFFSGLLGDSAATLLNTWSNNHKIIFRNYFYIHNIMLSPFCL